MTLEPTLAIDVGGTKLKAAIIDTDGQMVSDRLRMRTPYPCPPQTLIETLRELVEPLLQMNVATRAAMGLPGVVRQGRVVNVTPLARREYGGPREPDLIEAWAGFPIVGALGDALGLPTKVVNDADMQGCAVVQGTGFEFVMTLGTGVGTAVFSEGRLLPHMELSHGPFNDDMTIDIALGNHNLEKIGTTKWIKRVRRAIDIFHNLLWFDHLYVGGGNAALLDPADVGPKGEIVSNVAGLIGGLRVWELDS
jgi:polyphosphate glucokinase